MNGFSTMLKLNMKLLLRNKGFLCLLLIFPLFSVLLLNLQFNAADSYEYEDSHTIYEITATSSLTIMSHDKLSVMVNDADQSELADFILEQLADTGAYRLYRYRTDVGRAAEAADAAVSFANRNTIGAVLYFPPGLAENLRPDREGEALYLFEASEDARIPLLRESLETIIGSLLAYQELTAGASDEVKTLLTRITEMRPEKAFITVNLNNETTLTTKQQDYKRNLGYSLAVISIAFLSTGIFIGSVVVEERHNRVLTRIMLTTAPLAGYILIKLILSFLATLLQVAVMGIGIFLFVRVEFGLAPVTFLFFILGIGLIFNLLSMVISTITDNLISSSYIAFFIWSVSAMLSGLYFPLDSVSNWWNRAAMLMPPYWVLKCSEMAMLGENSVWVTFLLTTASFIILILAAGFLGLSVKGKSRP